MPRASGLTVGRHHKTPWKRWRGAKYDQLPHPQKFILPQEFNTSLIYSAYFVTARGTIPGSGALQNFRTNSPFDPDSSSTGGTRAYLFNQLALFWNRYMCYRSKIRVTTNIADDSIGATIMGAGLLHANQVMPTDPDELLQNPQFTTRVVPCDPTNPASTTNINLHWDLLSEPGAQGPSYLSNVNFVTTALGGTIPGGLVLTTSGWDAAVTENPLDSPAFVCFCLPALINPPNSELTPKFYMRVDIIYDTYFYNEILPVDSDIPT